LPLHLLLVLPRLLRADQEARVPVVEMAVLRQVGLFHILPPVTLESLAQGVRRVALEPNQVLVRQGDEGESFYAIAAGQIRIEQDGRPIATLGRGEGLGEIALLRSVPRTATAVACNPVVVLELSRDAFLTAVTGHLGTLDQANRTVAELRARDARKKR